MDVESIVKNMTLKEKCVILSGKNIWQTWDFPQRGIPSARLADGPHGLRRQTGSADHLGLNPSEKATCFPTVATVANSWDTDLAEEIGKAIGREAAAQGVNVLLGPGLNIKRNPLCGRNFEYFSEDPYLSGKMAAAYVSGIQQNGVAACPKHYAANSQELRRMSSNSVLDERTLREIYLTAFEIVVKEARPAALMSSYNEVNGEYANENPHLLRDILRNEWGFQGSVITDWGGSNDHVKGVLCGSTLEMPSPGLDSARQLIKAAEDGTVPEEIINRRVRELLHLISATQPAVSGPPDSFDEEAHHALARRAAAESIVLLKNEGSLLPLAQGTRVAVIGDFALKPRYQGAGSSLVNPTKLDFFTDCFDAVPWIPVGTEAGFMRNGAENETMQERAVALAGRADVVLLFLGLDETDEGEGKDRAHLRLPDNQTALFGAVEAANPNVAVILSAGSPVELPWANRAKAIVHCYLPGQAGACALSDVIAGKVNPSGKLSETMPLRYDDVPSRRYFPAIGRNAEYRESVYVGYRYYDKADIPVLFPFGHGLSYTTFAYSDLDANEKEIRFTLTNTGNRAGAEIAQFYVEKKDSVLFRPAKELKGFRKVFLEAGEAKRVVIPTDDKTFRVRNVKTNRWETEGGEYHILIGASSRSVRLRTVVCVKGVLETNPYGESSLPSYVSGDVRQVSDAEFEALMGRPLEKEEESQWIGSNDPLFLMRRAKSRLARFIYKLLSGRLEKSETAGTPNMNLLFVLNLTFRGIAKLTGGMVSGGMVAGLVRMVNGQFFSGMRAVIAGHFKNAKANKRMLAELLAAARADTDKPKV
ncbi:MAG: glycoside hydrolase family 3 C-terminal domain-containing protein [Clostridiales Family XIII bacterium]|jgi:beta-glucosidase|nr:glycoside hydrolase family 3 C-terminal domain-containing protein [Clostridiales Family XIII bacterium]